MNYTPIDEALIDNVSLTFKALADPTRIKILHLLFQRECSVSEIAETLKQLRLVKSRRDKTKYYYSPDDYHVMNLLEQSIEHAKHIS